jgi:hypothetical protein
VAGDCGKKRDDSKAVSTGKNAGIESIPGRDHELENMEKLTNSVGLWNMRFDAIAKRY